MKIGDLLVKNPIFLAPMAGITDLPFRLLCREQGCGVVFTEMISAKGLYYRNTRTQNMLEIHPDEHPIGVQIFGSEPLLMARMAEKISETSADLIDINMGCPAPKIVKNGEGSALLKNPRLVEEIVREVSRASAKPVTIKIRKGFDEKSINGVEIALIAEQAGAAAVTVHGRTREQFYSGTADWNIIKQVKSRLSIPVIGNGDIFSAQDALRMKEQTGCDGIMVARGAQGNPWLFRDIIALRDTGIVPQPPSARERIQTALRHMHMLIQIKGEKVGVCEIRKHVSWYLKGLKGAGQIRKLINTISTASEMEDTLLSYQIQLESTIQ
ncbi:MAG: tRNA dihydrouridine synthase DusB [Caldicoprobacterales bacterium]|jgi:tRNA-dihydrouridine synthase B|nr:tRNA dihydrouridine synthase DusB [Clostridiales bacterium]